MIPASFGSDLGLTVLLILVLVVPGLAVCLAAGLRGWIAAAAAPVLTVGLLGAAAPLLPAVAPTPIVVSLGVIAIGVVGLTLLGRRLARRVGENRVAESVPRGSRASKTIRTGAMWTAWHHVAVAAVLGAAAVVGALIVYRGSGYLTGIPQWWDAMFHASAIRYIGDTGNTHPAALGAISHAGAMNFYYPNGYHVFGAAVLQLSTTDVPHVINAINAIIPGFFGLSVTALTKHFGCRPAMCASIALLSCAFTSFPYDLIVWGPLFPYAVGLALVPAWLALLRKTLDDRRPTVGILLAIAAVGLLTVHPAAGIAAAMLGLGMVCQRWIDLRVVPATEVYTLALAGAATLAFGFPMVVGGLGASSGAGVDWAVSHSAAAAVGDLLTQSRGRSFPPWWLVGFAVLGLFGLGPLRNLYWYLVTGAGFGVLFVMAASYEGRLVALLTGPWWNDSWRLAALFTPVMLVLAANGCVVVHDATLAVLRAVHVESRVLWRSHRLALSGPVLGAVFLALFAVSEGLYQQDNASRVSNLYPDGPTVSRNERAALDRVGDIVPAGALVMNDPQDGSAWMWALEGTQPVFGAAVVMGRESSSLSDEQMLLYSKFNEIDVNSSVQDAVDRLGIQYVYLGEGFVDGGRSRAPGLENLDQVEALEPVFDSKDARLYRIRTTDEPVPA